ncbi:MAG: hypothetical protein KC588_10030 [Nitrospira sp.]|nr:hypothetical protein [Nitrospira sp.]
MDDDPRRHTITVAGNAEIMDAVRGFAGSLPFAADWMWAVDRFVDHVQPNAFLFRVDWQGEHPLAATLYCRFRIEPASRAFEEAIRTAYPIRWTGPDPAPVAAVLRVAGPRGVGLRVVATGACTAAVYFRVPEIHPSQAAPMVTALVGALGLPCHVPLLIEEDIRGLSSASGGVVGFGPDGEGEVTLKLNPPNVPIARALAFLAAKGASATRLDAIRNLAVSLHATSFSYLGMRYGANGFAGWRVYLSLEPFRLSVPMAPRLTLERRALPTLRLPHED